MYKDLLFDNKNGKAVITLNRPEVYNSLSKNICLELLDALQKAAADEQVKVIVISGSGKGFCSGQDIRQLTEMKDMRPSEYMEQTYNPIIRLIREMPKPVVCRLNGVAAGAGCSLALACDIIIASEDALLTEAFVNIGLVPDTGASYFLPRLTGRVKCFEMLSMGSKITAGEAVKLGLINKSVSPDTLDTAVNEVAEYYLSAPSLAIALIKDMVNRSYHVPLNGMLDLEAHYQNIAGATEDFKEGISAFMEKRKPKFTGK